MYCKRGVFVNWGNIPQQEFEFGPINLFSGGNGSGKTTAADGLQSLMTAAHENLFNFNPGQDETTQRGRGGKQVRTLASYILGCDDGSYSRPRPTDGYVAGIFHPTQGETGEVFTAVMGVRARLDTASSPRQARQDDILFLIIPGHALSLAHFVRNDESGKYVVPLNEIAATLKNELGKNAVEVYDKKGPYLRRLYGVLRGQKGAVSDREAKHAARTFSNFMAYKPVKSINDFVAREVLETKDLSEDIRQVSELMKTIHSMEEDTRKIMDAIGNLDGAQTQANCYVQNWSDKCVAEYTEFTRQLFAKQDDYLNQKNRQRSTQEAITEAEQQQERLRDKKQSLHDRLIDLKAQRQGIDALKDKDQLEQDVETCKTRLVQEVAPLLKQDQQFESNVDAARQLQKKLGEHSLGLDVPALEQPEFRKVTRKVLEAGESTGLDTQALLTKDWVGLELLETKLDGMQQLQTQHNEFVDSLYNPERTRENLSLRDQVFAALNKRREQLARFEQQVQAKEQEIRHLQNRHVSYPAHVQAAISAIKSQCPQARPSVLCDFIEVTDPLWQMAIEGYMGGARFAIIVEPEFEADAIRIVRNMKGGRNNARVIQGNKVKHDAQRFSPAKNSIIDVMTFDHKVVEYYVRASYGSVQRVSDEGALRQTSRGITANGLGSGGYSMFRCDISDADLVFGHGARERATQAKQEQLLQLQEQRFKVNDDMHHCQRIYDLIGAVKPLECADIIRNMLEMYRKLSRAETQLDSLDLSDFTELEGKLDVLNGEYLALEDEAKALTESIGAMKNDLERTARVIDKFASEQEQLQTLQEAGEQTVEQIADIWNAFNAEEALKAADDKARAAKGEFNFQADVAQYQQAMEVSERALYQSILHHNQISNTHDAIMYLTDVHERHDADFFKGIVNVLGQIGSMHNALKNNVLVGKHEKLSGLKESFNTAFVTNLCHSIYQSINDGKRLLEDLNKELEHHRFGADRERFYFGWDWVPEFHDYYRFFKEVISMPDLGDGRTLFESDLSQQSCDVRDRMMGMLLDKDEQVALRELKRISDYRNYRFYEIYKEPLNKEPIALSTYGTGSGGQLETPAYIIRSAAVTSAFRYNEGDTHCRMVLVDEAFSKMDETRSREVINYLTETLGLQLIFIMPTSKSGPFMDLISNQVVFSKCPMPAGDKIGELNTRVLVDRKICNQERIKALWANHRKTIRQQAMLDFMEEIV
ncbi:Chromosome partition protein Smc [BD1-7 clade bacterium]|uniref:Chromosome partition protein Smc n=1 Tax=BD1-7 clade bacterium TaxID=2029982 RepID=A0A5S9PET9_9GAMM|nr:Chromosome partition protein Smc [BD1-7 clade bacterium]